MSARSLLFHATLAVLLLVAAPAVAEPTLVEKARTMGLAQSIAWQRLLHYRSTGWGGWVSEIDGKEFFLAPHGKEDPEAELVATLSAFQEPLVAGHEDAHALCRFPARRLLLDEMLHFDASLEAPSCPALAGYASALDPTGVAIVYSSNYLANPASAFGHTFLRLKKRRPPGSLETSEQLDFGVDYFATTDTKNPLFYAFKGLAGLFPGTFRFHSYETKIREYGNLEARDLWEYDLALTEREVTLLAMHLWELAATHIDYFYLTKNCSYQVLAALEAAVPRVDLISDLNAVVLPKDTIKALFTIPGLVQGVHYRPSLRSQFRGQIERLGPREKEMVARLALDPATPLPGDFSAAESARVLDVALQVLDARFAKPLASSRESGDLAADKARLLERRALLSPSVPPPPPIPTPVDKAPEVSHGSMRITVGAGATTQYGDGFASFGYRLVLHDLADPPAGEPELSELQFFDTQLRYDMARSALTLDRLTFADLLALNPITRFEHALSWRIRAFGSRLHDEDCPDGFAHGLEGALGATLATENEHMAIFLMADTYAAFSGSLDGIGGSFVRVGVGPYAGLRVRLPLESIAVVTGNVAYLPGERLKATYDVRATLRSSVGKDIALGVEAALQPLSKEVALNSYFYF
jgi:Domain of unknown function (DUF4105)